MRTISHFVYDNVVTIFSFDRGLKKSPSSHPPDISRSAQMVQAAIRSRKSLSTSLSSNDANIVSPKHSKDAVVRKRSNWQCESFFEGVL